jgi:hypothetical protein
VSAVSPKPQNPKEMINNNESDELIKNKLKWMKIIKIEKF